MWAIRVKGGEYKWWKTLKSKYHFFPPRRTTLICFLTYSLAKIHWSLVVVTWQNVENVRAGESFCKALGVLKHVAFWWGSFESKYWCNHSYFQCWHTTGLQFILLFTTLFIQPVQIEPQPVPVPPSSFQHSSSLDVCVTTWLRWILHTELLTEGKAHCHAGRNDPSDCSYTLLHQETIQTNPNHIS